MGITSCTWKIKLLIFAEVENFLEVVGLLLDLDWIVNPFLKVDLDFQSHIVMDLDWIEQQHGYGVWDYVNTSHNILVLILNTSCLFLMYSRSRLICD